VGALEQLNRETLARYTSERLTGVRAIKLFYLFTGRNAWWRTWVQKYRYDCMHPDVQSAQDAAERQRTQGSVFNIEELPALIFIFARVSLIVTEINAPNPLSGYSRRAVRKRPPDGSEMIPYADDNYLFPDARFDGVSLSFEHSSRFWRRPPPPRDHVVQLLTTIHASRFKILGDEVLYLYTSQSAGVHYPLNWSRKKTDIKPNAVRAVTTGALEEAKQIYSCALYLIGHSEP
jgi:hypothetical protein